MQEAAFLDRLSPGQSGCQGNRVVSLAEEMNFVKQLVKRFKSLSALRTLTCSSWVPGGTTPPGVRISILVGKVTVLEMYLNLIVLIDNLHFDSSY